MLFEQIRKNKRNTVIIMGIFGGLIMLVGYFFAKSFSGGNPRELWKILLDWLLFVLLYIGFKYLTSMWTVLKMTKAQSVTEEQYPQLYHIVQDMALVAHIPMPKVYVIDDPCPNAFATGTSYQKAAVAVTTGLLQLMNREELEGVIGHEVSHIRNYDIRVSTIAVALTALVMLIGTLLVGIGKWTFWGSAFLSDDRTDRKEGGGSLYIGIFGIFIWILGFLFLIIGVPVAELLQFAVSRQRESLADVSSVELTRNPAGLISAFRKLQKVDLQPKVNNSTVTGLYFYLPKVKGLAHLFDTHPPLEERIKRLEEIEFGKQLKRH
ncbi:M48 family metalloprotease [Liquorilactobacillus sicerae]|uniref:M48 family metalloprotease n=1 Tax=Liquorilactobacillus sicerae TaxID=1416943 RepID=UPI0024812532|nr:M48 family metalloprotease [Liquorilactobacillus sicerae]